MMSSHDYHYPLKYHEEVQLMALFIETLTGTTFEVTVSPYDTVISIKAKIQRIEGIPVSQQHLLYNLKELEDSVCLKEYSLHDGATVKLVLSMRGGPISTVRRIFPLDDAAWKELVNFNKEEMLDDLPPGCKMAILIFREGDQLNLLRVLENLDGSYSPFSDICCETSVSNLFEENDSKDGNKRLEENTVTMEKMHELRNKLEDLSLERKLQRSDKDKTRTSRKVPSVLTSPTQASSILQLPPLGHRSHDEDSMLNSRTEFTRVPVLPNISTHTSPEVSPRFTIVDSNTERMAVAGSHLLLEETRPKTSPDHLTERQLCEILSEASRHRHVLLQTHSLSRHYTSSTVKSMHRSTSNVECESDWRRSPAHHSFITSTEKLIPPCTTKHTSSLTPVVNSESGKVNRLLIAKPLKNIFQGRNGESNLYVNKSAVKPLNRVTSKTSDLASSRKFLTIPKNSLKLSTLSSLSGSPSEALKNNRVISEDSNSKYEDRTDDLSTPSYNINSDKLGNNKHIETNRNLEDLNCRSNASEEIITSNLKKKVKGKRCAQCKKRLTLTNLYTCRCGNVFCSSHRYSETHSCSFDYKTEGRKLLQQANPVVTSQKLPKI